MARFRSNGFLLVIPVLIWNVVFWRLLPAGAGTSVPVPASLQWAEHILRAMVFGIPVLLTIQSRGSLGRVGWAVYLAGIVAYFASWIPWLEGYESDAITLLLGPYLTPMLVFAGIATLSRSWMYALTAVVFVAVHAGLGLVRAGIN